MAVPPHIPPMFQYTIEGWELWENSVSLEIVVQRCYIKLVALKVLELLTKKNLRWGTN